MVNFFASTGVAVGLGVALGDEEMGAGVALTMFPNSYFTRIIGFEKVNPASSIT